MTNGERRWCIVGGGMLGMTLALRLAERGQHVTLLEAAGHLGGLADAWQVGDLTWDRHYHVTLLSDLRLRGLLEQLGLADQMRWVTTKTGFYTDGRLCSLSNSWEFLRFPPLSLWHKIRLAFTILRASRIRHVSAWDEVPVADWLRRWSGVRTYERIWAPLLRAKLGAAADRVSAVFILATIQRMYAARRSGLKRELFGYWPGGYARLLAEMEKRLAAEGVEVVKGAPVRELTRAADAWRVVTAPGAVWTGENVVLTVPSPVAAALCPQLPPPERRRLEDVEYLGVVCASVVLRQPLADYYVTNITDGWPPFTGVIEMTALVDRGEFQGKTLVYLPLYAHSTDPVFRESDASIEGRFTSALLRMYPHLQMNDILAFRISRVPRVMALPVLGYARRVPPVRTSLPGLFVVNSSQITDGTLNVNETLKLVEQNLALLLSPHSVSTEVALPPGEHGHAAADRQPVA